MATVDRIMFVKQKRTALKAQLTCLTNLLDQNSIDKTVAKARMERIVELYKAYENMHDDLAISNPGHESLNEFVEIQNRFFDLKARTNTFIESDNQSVASSESTVRNAGQENMTLAYVKLPEAPLPKFDGTIEKWLEFKETFIARIDSKRGLPDVEKFHYLKSALTGSAAVKLQSLSTRDVNYSKAWDILNRSYHAKRILISRHLDLLRELPVLQKETCDGLSKLADDMQQHVAALSSLDVTLPSEMLVNLLESKLPKSTLENWARDLKRDAMPDIENMYEFLYESAVRKSIASTSTSQYGEPPSKRPRYKKPADNHHYKNQTFALDTSSKVTRKCPCCKGDYHHLTLCSNFRTLNVSQRRNIVKNAGVCYNCMKFHKAKDCYNPGCKVCGRKHHVMLHINDDNTLKNETASRENTQSSA